MPLFRIHDRDGADLGFIVAGQTPQPGETIRIRDHQPYTVIKQVELPHRDLFDALLEVEQAQP